MSNYQLDTLALIPGTTPREKYEALQKMLLILQQLAYPRRGTEEESLSREEFADQVAAVIPISFFNEQ